MIPLHTATPKPRARRSLPNVHAAPARGDPRGGPCGGWWLALVLVGPLPALAGTDSGAATTGSAWPATTTVEAVHLEIDPEPVLQAVPRIGINLGRWTYWGAEQLSRNVLKNPGFEGLIDRALVHVSSADRHRFVDDQRWLGRPDGFWIGAQYEVLSGAGAGAQGSVIDSRTTSPESLPAFTSLERLPPKLRPGDIIAVTRIRDDLPPSHWWWSEDTVGRVTTDPAMIAPGSPGRRSLLLHPAPGETLRLASHLDTITDRAGVLLPVRGTWRLAFWLRVEDPAATEVRVLFRRHGSAPFLDETLVTATGWQRIEREFEVRHEQPPGALELRFEVRDNEQRKPARVWLDDVWLGSLAPEPSSPGTAHEPPVTDHEEAALAAFRPEVVALLQRLRPGYLRDWQGQLGDTLDNRLAPPEERRASRYRPDDTLEWGYGLPEFLDLSRTVGAQPWLVMPTTFGTDEARRLGSWLVERLRADGFEEILVEFGNENWNAVFRPAGIADPAHHGAAADRLFRALRDGAGGHPAIRAVIQAQHANPAAALATARASTQAEILALAPYRLQRLDAVEPVAALPPLFATDEGRLAAIARDRPTQMELAVYEVNLHTTRGTTDSDTRRTVVAGAAAGTALAQSLLEAMFQGAARQCVYRLSGFDTRLEDGAGTTPLFGITRDLTGNTRLRPTGLAVALLNEVIGGNLHRVRISAGDPSGLLAAAFAGPEGWSLALLSNDARSREITLHLPHPDRPAPTHARLLDGSDPFLSNEREARVVARRLPVHQAPGGELRITLPPFSLAVLQPGKTLNKGSFHCERSAAIQGDGTHEIQALWIATSRHAASAAKSLGPRDDGFISVSLERSFDDGR